MSKRLNLKLSRHRAQTDVPASAPAPAPTQTADAAKQVARINDLISLARKSWFGLLSYLGFVGVTLLGVEDADFFIADRQTDLPLVGVSIPTVLFFYIAPTIGAALYAYFHLHLLKLYEALGRADRTHVPLADRTAPWMVADFALAWRPGEMSKRPMRWLAFATTLLLAYIAGPLVLFAFWFRSMPYHEELLTVIFCGIPLMVVLYAGRRSWSYMIAQFRPDQRRRPSVQFCLALLGGVARVLVVALGWLATEGSFEHYVRQFDWFDDTGEMTHLGSNPAHAQWWGDPRWDFMLYPANLAGVNFVDAPEDWREHDAARAEFRDAWCGTEGIPEQACGSADPFAQLSDEAAEFLQAARLGWCADIIGGAVADLQPLCDTRFLEFESTFAADWTTEWAILLNSLTARNLSGFDLRGADLTDAQLQGANLSTARLQGASLRAAELQGANLSQAKMQGVVLFGALMQRAVLGQVEIQQADLSFAQMQGAFFSIAQMQGADLFGAQVQDAVFSRAQMQGTVLFGAQMQGADLFEVQLQGADLRSVAMSDTTALFNSSIRGAGINSVDDATLAQLSAHRDWDDAYYQDEVLFFVAFTDDWRAFATNLDPPVTIAPDFEHRD
ncbi:pentapeptide repeat-containing protein [Jannaschia sp. CCS1]|uniref:pentapeptide repeat-containing protein n=1 Tax=Jannaschia sp. (strain CCS1) TaxID=290400 RepID=UPI000053A424|nr:pentapeptide repeat-containing protein [Jannaschia sp. CCS1]ABD53999.1 pentapeptide protein [Jannaschia sp. CCS1]